MGIKSVIHGNELILPKVNGLWVTSGHIVCLRKNGSGGVLSVNF